MHTICYAVKSRCVVVVLQRLPKPNFTYLLLEKNMPLNNNIEKCYLKKLIFPLKKFKKLQTHVWLVSHLP